MSGRIYSSVFSDVGVSLAQDIFEVVAADTSCVELLSFHLSQTSELADAAEEQLRIVVQGHTGSNIGSGGTDPAVVPTHLGDNVSTTIVQANNTTEVTAGTTVTHAVYNWNIRVPLDVIWIPETRLWIAPTDFITVTLLAAPADIIQMGGTIYFREVGGV